jgi:hypothetical protein
MLRLNLFCFDWTGQNAWWGARFLISFVEFQSRNILRMVAFNEIFLMPLAVFLIFAGNTELEFSIFFLLLYLY